jgi:hypothetical protein
LTAMDRPPFGARSARSRQDVDESVEARVPR